MTMTWWSFDSLRKISPMRRATPPEMPVSISSKISVGSGMALATSDLVTSVRRDSSPPEATPLMGISRLPGLAAKRNCTSS